MQSSHTDTLGSVPALEVPVSRAVKVMGINRHSADYMKEAAKEMVLMKSGSRSGRFLHFLSILSLISLFVVSEPSAIPVLGQDVLTQHNDNQRTGANLRETI